MPDPKPIIVVGSSGHARSVIDVIERAGECRIVGLIDSFRRAGESAFGYEVLGTENDIPRVAAPFGVRAGFVAIGDNWQRHLMVRRILELAPDFEFVTAIHPSAQLARGVVVGRGSVLMAGTVVNVNARIGEFCLVNTRSSLDHDAVMEDFASLAPGATTGGMVRIAAFAAVGLGANVIQRRRVGEQAVVGAGALVVEDVPEYCVAYGVPARVVRKRASGDPYLEG